MKKPNDLASGFRVLAVTASLFLAGCGRPTQATPQRPQQTSRISVRSVDTGGGTDSADQEQPEAPEASETPSANAAGSENDPTGSDVRAVSVALIDLLEQIAEKDSATKGGESERK